MYHVLLFYKLFPFKKPKEEVKKHKEVCKALQLKGRVLMNEDGINGIVGGTPEQIRLYREYMDAHRQLKNIDFKQSESDFNPFPRMQVKYREEIITTEVREQINLNKRGTHIDRDTFHQWLVDGKDMIIVDMRNDYEYAIGRFKNAVRPPVQYFRELKDNMDYYEQFKEKTVVMYCTGGIRCEPASALFVEHGFNPDNLFQLEGGIVKYAEKYGNEGFYEGKCFMFDDRLAIDVDTSESARVVGECLLCGGAEDAYRNCIKVHCNKLFVGCDACVEEYENTCSRDCQQKIKDSANLRPAQRRVGVE